MSFNFNPKKKENLTPIMKQVIAQLMQVGLLEEVCSANTWTAKDLVFQGGTSIHLLWNSPRLSEDLDFIVSIDKTKEIDKILNKSLKTLQRKVSLILPETQLRLKKYQRSEEELHNVIAYDVVWTQPQKIGAVKVKLEFYITKCDLIEKYNKQFKTQNNSFIIRTTPELNDLDIDSLISDTLIPVATPESIYA
jgi:oligoribonuclease NrnB/cAMP/cGMP phosphodiesterase (DHH superfamily)